MKKRRSLFQKAISLFTGLLLVFQSLTPGFFISSRTFAQDDATGTPTPTTSNAASPTATPTDATSNAASPTATPTPTEKVEEATGTPTATPTPSTEVSPTETQDNTTITPTPTTISETTKAPEAKETKETGWQQPTATPTPTLTEEPKNNSPPMTCEAPSETRTSSVFHWSVDEFTRTAETTTKVELGVKYEFPGNHDVSVTFTCLPKDPEKRTSLKIQEINISELKLPSDINAATDKAYDITTGMGKETFTYTITLPKNENTAAGISYIGKTLEEAKKNEINAEEIKKVDEDKIEQTGNKVEASEMNHFSIYIATKASDLTTDKSSYNQGEIVYIRANGLYSSKYYKVKITHYTWGIRDINQTIVSCQQGNHDITGNYTLSSNASNDSSWYAELYEYNDDDCDYYNWTNTSDSFTVVKVNTFDHIDIRLDSIYNVTINSTTYPVNGTVTGDVSVDVVNAGAYNHDNYIIPDVVSSTENEFRLTGLTLPNTLSPSNFRITAAVKLDDIYINSIPNLKTVLNGLKNGSGDYIIQVIDYTPTQNVCTGGPGGTYANATGYDFVITQAVSAQLTGTLNVVKTVVPSTDPGKFNLFIGSTPHATNVGNGGQTGAKTVTAGTVTFSETAETGTNLSNYTTTYSAGCENGQTTVAVGESKTCTITNTRKAYCGNGTVNPGEQCDDGNTTDDDYCSNACAINHVKVNLCHATPPETAANGWNFDQNVDDDSVIKTTGHNAHAADIIPAFTYYGGSYPGKNLTTLFNGFTGQQILTNGCDYPKGTVTFRKTVDDGSGVLGWLFTVKDAGGATIGAYHSGDSATLNTGSYTVIESGGTGYHLNSTSGSCSTNTTSGVTTLTINKGANQDCTFANAHDRGTIIIKKVVSPSTDTTKFTFTGDVSGSIGHNEQITTANILTGTYHTTETLPSGWALSSISCDDNNSTGNITTKTADITLDANETVTCTFTNAKDGQITVYKDVRKPDGQDVNDDFRFLVKLNSTIPQALKESAPVVYTVGAGSTNTVIETSSGSYDALGCKLANGNTATNFIVPAGQNVDVTCTNKQRQGVITVYKNVLGPDGITDVTDTKLFRVTVNNVQKSVMEGIPVTYSVDPGTYTATEQLNPITDLYDFVRDTGSVTIASGGTGAITITNKQQYGTISGMKYNDVDGDGTKDVGESGLAGWTIQLQNSTGSTVLQTATTDANGGYSFSVIPGIYRVREVAQTGWIQKSVDPANITVMSGQKHLQKNFGNQGYATITVDKITDPSGDARSFDFTVQKDTTTVDTFSLKDSDAPHSDLYLFGRYTISEATDSAWTQGNISCSGGMTNVDKHTGSVSFDISAGATANCTFTNTQNPLHLYAQKVMCDSETYLPNNTQGAITETTAQNWVNQSGGHCQLANNWNFQYGGIGSFGAFQTNTQSLSDPWKTITTVSGIATAAITDLTPYGNKIEVREVFPNTTYVPFTNDSNVSAEFYCSGDTANYDNWEWINNPKYGNNYYCVAFNAVRPAKLTVIKQVDTNNDGIIENTNATDWQWNIKDGEQGIATGQYRNLNAGSYTISETTKSEYKLKEWSCTNETRGTKNSINVNLEPGEDVTCTFTNTRNTGSIRVCKVILDSLGNIVDGSALPDSTFSIAGLDTTTSQGGAAGVFGTSTFQTPLSYNTKLFKSSVNNASCVSYTNLIPGNYYYGQESVPGDVWSTPVYNDGATVPTSITDNFLPYSGELFDTNPSNDGSRKTPSDGHIVLSPGQQNRTLIVLNQYKFGSVTVTKFNDANDNGIYDSGEATLSGWDITLTGQPTKTTDERGVASFSELVPSTYYLDETVKDGWEQTVISCSNEREQTMVQPPPNNIARFGIEKVHAQEMSGHPVSVGPGENVACVIGNHYIPAVLHISKQNNITTDITPGTAILYTLIIKALDNTAYGVKVTDLLPKGFTYRGGSWTASSNKNGALSLGEPTYHSPGTWDVGNMEKDEEITLTLIADVSTDEKPGIYKDLALAYGCQKNGDCTVGGTNSLIASAVDPGQLGTTFVGTAVTVVKDQQDSKTLTVGHEQKIEGSVLGATTDLPSTGANANWIIVAITFVITGLGMVIVSKKMRRYHA